MPLGRDSFVGWAEEPTWGTAVPPTKFGELISESMLSIRTRTPRPTFRDLDAREANIYDELRAGKGSFGVEINYDGLLRLFHHLMGIVSTTVIDAGVRWKHAFTLAPGELQAGKGLTIDMAKGLGQQFRFTGCKIGRTTISLAPERNAQIEFGIIGKEVAAVADTTPAFPGGTLFVAGHTCSVEVDDVVRLVDSIELTIDNALIEERRALGSKNPYEPVRSDNRRAITGVLTADAAIADWNKLDAGTLFKLEALHAGPALGAATYKFEITALKCLITEDPITVKGPGIVKSAIPFRVLKPTSGEAIEIAVYNDESVVA